MKYFKITNKDNDVKRIAGEIINLFLNKEVFINGVQKENVEDSAYNNYKHNNITYEFYNKSGVVYSTDMSIIEPIKAKCSEFWFHFIKNNTEYQTWNVQDVQRYTIIEQLTDVFESKINFGHKDGWQILDASQIPLNVNAKDRLMYNSTSCIIYDTINLIDLPDGYQQMDYPTVKQFTAFKEGKTTDKVIYAYPHFGVALDLAAYYHYEPESFNFIEPQRNLSWIRFQDVKPILLTQQMNLITYLENDIIDAQEQKYATKNFKCAMLGIPIYDDCYVMDIYKRNITKTILESELDKYPNATVVSSEIKRKKSYKTIKYTVTYDSPRHILVSPYYIHFRCKMDGFKMFEKTFDCSVLAYRTKCPTTFLEVLETLNTDSAHKKILTEIYDGKAVRGITGFESPTIVIKKSSYIDLVHNTKISAVLYSK